MLTLLDVTTTTAATAEENIDAETLPRQVPREKEERARKKEDRGEVSRKTSRRHAGLRRQTPAAP